MTSTWRNIPSHGAPEVISSPFQRSLWRDHLGITWVSIGVVKFLNSTYSKMGPHGPHLGLHFGQSTEFVREFLANIQLLIPTSPPVELPSDNLTLLLKMAIEIVDLPMKKKKFPCWTNPLDKPTKPSWVSLRMPAELLVSEIGHSLRFKVEWWSGHLRRLKMGGVLGYITRTKYIWQICDMTGI